MFSANVIYIGSSLLSYMIFVCLSNVLFFFCFLGGLNLNYVICKQRVYKRARWHSGRASDSKWRGPGLIPKDSTVLCP